MQVCLCGSHFACPNPAIPHAAEDVDAGGEDRKVDNDEEVCVVGDGCVMGDGFVMSAGYDVLAHTHTTIGP